MSRGCSSFPDTEFQAGECLKIDNFGRITLAGAALIGF